MRDGLCQGWWSIWCRDPVSTARGSSLEKELCKLCLERWTVFSKQKLLQAERTVSSHTRCARRCKIFSVPIFSSLAWRSRFGRQTASNRLGQLPCVCMFVHACVCAHAWADLLTCGRRIQAVFLLQVGGVIVMQGKHYQKPACWEDTLWQAPARNPSLWVDFQLVTQLNPKAHCSKSRTSGRQSWLLQAIFRWLEAGSHYWHLGPGSSWPWWEGGCLGHCSLAASPAPAHWQPVLNPQLTSTTTSFDKSVSRHCQMSLHLANLLYWGLQFRVNAGVSENGPAIE